MSGIPPPLARLTLLGKQADTFGNPLSGTRRCCMIFTGVMQRPTAASDTIIITKWYCEAHGTAKRIAVSLFQQTRSEGDGCRAVPMQRLPDVLGTFPLIINTVPAMLLDPQMLRLVRKDALILDLASKPGGDEAKDNAVPTDRDMRKDVNA